MRKIKIAPGEYYHIYNRGVNKQNIFLDNKDWIRFLFLIVYLQSPVNFPQIGRAISGYVKNQVFDNVKEKTAAEILKTRYVELTCFTIMPNHFHLVLREFKERGISKYMERIQKAYAKYSNTKHGKSGHVFQGTFQAIHIKNSEQLLHLSAYIHRNPRERKQWRNKEQKYPWSSYQDYIEKNRWGKLLKIGVILNQFSSPKQYKEFIDTSGTKLKLDEEDLLV